VIHLLAQPLSGDEVRLHVDGTSRALHSQLHSAGHLIGYAGERYGWQPVKAHHWPGEGRITFNAGENATQPETTALQALIADWKAAALPRIVEFNAGRRSVRFGDLTSYGCGGTHLATLAELREVVISAIKIKKGQLIIHYTVQ